MDDFQALMRDAPSPNDAAGASARDALDGTGVLADLSSWRARWLGETAIRRPILVLFASTFPNAPDGAAKARERLEQLAQGAGAANRLARRQGAGVEAFDLAIDRAVRDAAHISAMSLRETAATLAFGMEATAKTPDLLILSDLTVASEYSAAALIFGVSGEGPGDHAFKIDDWVARAADRARAASPETPLDWLAELGGREIAALVGAIFAARASGVPVILDGLAALAAALVAHRIDPRATEHLLCASRSHDPACRIALSEMGLTPIFQEETGESRGVCGLGVLGLLRAIEDAPQSAGT
jgi:nicotinate-nucleotide--dimethylbenzimidazole phosphoribosyltransferase